MLDQDNLATTKEHIEAYMKRIQFSGYTPKFKGEVVKSALKAYRKLLDMDEQTLELGASEKTE